MARSQIVGVAIDMWLINSKGRLSTHPLETASFQAREGADGTGIEPAPCGFGACCRSFSTVQGRTRTRLKWPILTVESTWTFTSVHRRWGQQWGQPLETENSSFAWTLLREHVNSSMHEHTCTRCAQ